jgi:hypothetical protein
MSCPSIKCTQNQKYGSSSAIHQSTSEPGHIEPSAYYSHIPIQVNKACTPHLIAVVENDERFCDYKSWNEEGIKRAQIMLSSAGGSSYTAHVYLHRQHNSSCGSSGPIPLKTHQGAQPVHQKNCMNECTSRFFRNIGVQENRKCLVSFWLMLPYVSRTGNSDGLMVTLLGSPWSWLPAFISWLQYRRGRQRKRVSFEISPPKTSFLFPHPPPPPPNNEEYKAGQQDGNTELNCHSSSQASRLKSSIERLQYTGNIKESSIIFISREANVCNRISNR